MILLSVERLADEPERSCLGLPAMQEPTCRITHKVFDLRPFGCFHLGVNLVFVLLCLCGAFQLTESENGVALHTLQLIEYEPQDSF